MAEADFTLIKNNAREAQTEPKANSGPRYTMSPDGFLTFMWDHVDTSTMSDANLEWLSNASDIASLWAQNLGDTLSGIGCLVAEDVSADKVARSGALQDQDLPSLLFSAAESLRTISAMTFIASEAEFKLRDRLAMRLRPAA
ncbi:hypothetical protein D9M68_297900 [compost metagenome]